MTIEINLSPEETGKVIADTEEQSIVLQRSDFNLTSTNNDKVIHTLSTGWAKSHTAGGDDKSDGDTTLGEVDVPLKNVYEMVSFHDFQADDNAALVNRVVETMPGVLSKSYTGSIFGTTFWAESPFTAVTTNTADVDDTSESWQAAIDTVYDAGFNPDTIILATQARKLVKKAYIEDAGTNTLRDGAITDIDGVDVFFRNLRSGALVDGDVIGIVYDSSQLVTYLKDEMETDFYSRHEDYSLRKANKDAVYVGSRFGFAAADEDAFVFLTYSAPVVEG